MRRRFPGFQWKSAVSYAGVAALTALALEAALFLVVGVFGPRVGDAWSGRTAQRRAAALAASVTAALEARSAERLIEAIDKPSGLSLRALASASEELPWDEARVVIGTGGHVVASNQPGCYPSGSSFLEPGLPEAELAVAEALEKGSASSRVADELGLYLAALPLTNSNGTQLGVLYYRQPVLVLSRSPGQLLGPILLTTAVVLPCAILLGLVSGVIPAMRLTTPASSSPARSVLESQQDPAPPVRESLPRSRERYDGIKRHFFGLNLATASALNLLDTNREAARAKLLEAREHSRQAQAGMETWLDELDPGDAGKPGPAGAGDRGLVAALADHLSTYEGQKSVKVRWQSVERLALPPTHEEALLDVAREALANITHHAQASQVTVELNATKDTITLRIVDDGQGSDPAAAEAGTPVELMGIGGRLTALGGTYTVGTAPDAGTRIIATLPRR